MPHQENQEDEDQNNGQEMKPVELVSYGMTVTVQVKPVICMAGTTQNAIQ